MIARDIREHNIKPYARCSEVVTALQCIDTYVVFVDDNDQYVGKVGKSMGRTFEDYFSPVQSLMPHTLTKQLLLYAVSKVKGLLESSGK